MKIDVFGFATFTNVAKSDDFRHLGATVDIKPFKNVKKIDVFALGPKFASCGPNMAPRWRLDRPIMHRPIMPQDGSMLREAGPMLAQDGHMLTQDGAQDGYWIAP